MSKNSKAETKQTVEMSVFLSFARAASLAVESPDGKTIPPVPDIRCKLNGLLHYFELSQIIDEEVAKDLGDQRKRKADVSEGTFFREEEPLIKLIQKKCNKKYETEGYDLDLLLYYDGQVPINPDATLKANKSVVIGALRPNGPFSRIWIYDSWSKSFWKRPD